MTELLIVQAGGDIDTLDTLVRDHFHQDNTDTYYPKQSRKFLERAANKAYGTQAIKAKGWDAQQATQAMLQIALEVYDTPEKYPQIEYPSRTTILGAVAMSIDVLTLDVNSQKPRQLYASISDHYGLLVPTVLLDSKGPYSEWTHAAVIAGKALRQELDIEVPTETVKEQLPPQEIEGEKKEIPLACSEAIEELNTRHRLSSMEYTYLIDLFDETGSGFVKTVKAAEALANMYNHKLKKISERTGGLSKQPLVLPAALSAYAKKNPKKNFLPWMIESYKSRHANETEFDDSVIREAVTARVVSDINILHSIA